ncbi:MAG: aminoglycoside phosphotransferase family protein [Nannocystaceae bacterium]
MSDPRGAALPVAGAEPGPELRRWASSILGGAPLRWRWLRPREGPTSVWIVDDEGGARAVIKAHARGRGFAQELAAHRALAGPLRRWIAPLLAASAARSALAFAVIDGVTPEDDGDPPLHRRAGELLRALHAVPTAALGDDDPMPVEAAIERRWQGALDAAAPRLGRDRCARLAGSVRPGIFRGLTRVIAHRDFAPDNWIVATDGELRVIDFEQCRADLALVDRVILAGGPWRRRPALRAAFDAGYGAPLDDLGRERLAMLRILDAVTTVTWARRRGVARRCADAEALLAALERDPHAAVDAGA